MALDLITGLGKFLFILWEIGVSRWRKQPVYRFERTMGTVGCEVLRVLASLVFVPMFVGGYLYLSNHYSLFSLSASAVSTWVVAVFVFSFVDYWSHRWSHEVPFLWAIHSVHHQVEELNAIAGGRVSFLNDTVTLSMLFILAILGIPLPVTLGVVGAAALYSVVLHCPFIGGLGWIGYVVASPAFHRLHHGIQPQYVNKNYSISLSFWDRVFGTHVEQTVPPKYGLPNGFATNSPFQANWQPWVDYFTKTKWTYAAITLMERSLSQRLYFFSQLFFVLLLASFLSGKTGPDLDTGIGLLVLGAVLGSLATLDGLVRQSRIAYYAEGIRVGLFMPWVFSITRNENWPNNSFWWLCGSGAVFFLVWLWAAFRGAKFDATMASKDRRPRPADAA